MNNLNISSPSKSNISTHVKSGHELSEKISPRINSSINKTPVNKNLDFTTASKLEFELDNEQTTDKNIKIQTEQPSIDENVIKNEMDEKEELINKIVLLKKEIEASKRTSSQQIFHNVIHKYNETKDIAQELLGRIALVKNKMVKDLYEDLGISDDDA